MHVKCTMMKAGSAAGYILSRRTSSKHVADIVKLSYFSHIRSAGCPSIVKTAQNLLTELSKARLKLYKRQKIRNCTQSYHN
jgi:hypothetical protein